MTPSLSACPSSHARSESERSSTCDASAAGSPEGTGIRSNRSSKDTSPWPDSMSGCATCPRHKHPPQTDHSRGVNTGPGQPETRPTSGMCGHCPCRNVTYRYSGRAAADRPGGISAWAADIAKLPLITTRRAAVISTPDLGVLAVTAAGVLCEVCPGLGRGLRLS